MDEQRGWYFTAPWDPVPIRRGDALGFRASADYFADLLAPGLSNNTSDARWISILSWCLQWSHVAWRSAGGGDLSRRDDQRARYAWLRPLELLWVDRTLETGQDTGQLRGRRSVERWRRADRRAPNFAMTADQFRRYRQVGTYGAYRVVFRGIPGLTTGDGWTPSETALKLAGLVNDSLPRAARLKQEHFENGTKWGIWIGGEEARYWIERGWQASWSTLGGFLPTPNEAIRKRLPAEERDLLEPAIFANGHVRRVTAEVLASASAAQKHAELCDALASSTALSAKIEPASLAPLPSFTRFADAAMHAMRTLWNEINHDNEKQATTVEKLARSGELRDSLERLRQAASAWLRAPGRNTFPHESVVTRLAEAALAASTPAEQVRALSKHHHEHGGGLRWFREQAGKMVPLVPDTGIAATDYRFRLRPLARLAAQCGVANMNQALDAIAQQEPDDEEADAL
jgi:hypothetical protein